MECEANPDRLGASLQELTSGQGAISKTMRITSLGTHILQEATRASSEEVSRSLRKLRVERLEERLDAVKGNKDVLDEDIIGKWGDIMELLAQVRQGQSEQPSGVLATAVDALAAYQAAVEAKVMERSREPVLAALTLVDKPERVDDITAIVSKFNKELVPLVDSLARVLPSTDTLREKVFSHKSLVELVTKISDHTIFNHPKDLQLYTALLPDKKTVSLLPPEVVTKIERPVIEAFAKMINDTVVGKVIEAFGFKAANDLTRLAEGGSAFEQCVQAAEVGTETLEELYLWTSSFLDFFCALAQVDAHFDLNSKLHSDEGWCLTLPSAVILFSSLSFTLKEVAVLKQNEGWFDAPCFAELLESMDGAETKVKKTGEPVASLSRAQSSLGDAKRVLELLGKPPKSESKDCGEDGESFKRWLSHEVATSAVKAADTTLTSCTRFDKLHQLLADCMNHVNSVTKPILSFSAKAETENHIDKTALSCVAVSHDAMRLGLLLGCLSVLCGVRVHLVFCVLFRQAPHAARNTHIVLTSQVKWQT